MTTLSDIIGAGVEPDGWSSPATHGTTNGFCQIVTKDGRVIATDVKNSDALETRRFFSDMLGQPLDIIETETYGVRDENIFDGTAQGFRHGDYHLSNNPETDGATRHSSHVPVDLPTYVPWNKKETKKVGKEKVYKSKEVRYSNPGRGRDFYVIRVSDLSIVYVGTKSAGVENLKQRVARRGEHLNDYRVYHRTMVQAYFLTVLSDGWVAYVNGNRVAMGLKKEVISYLETEVKAGRINKKSISIKHISVAE